MKKAASCIGRLQANPERRAAAESKKIEENGKLDNR
jgi:hypothetical protein